MANIAEDKSVHAPATKAPISKRVADEAQPGRIEYVIWDDGGRGTVKGFGLKVTPAGSKVYIFRYRVPLAGEVARNVAPRKVTLGKHGNITADQARTRARALAASVTNGIDPLQAKADVLAANASINTCPLTASCTTAGASPVCKSNFISFMIFLPVFSN